MRRLLFVLTLALASAGAAASPEPIGISLHNPGNIRDVRWRCWKGAVGIDAHQHMRFKSAFWGLRAIRINLQAYGRGGFNTPRAIAARWGSLNADAAAKADYTRMLCQVLRCGPEAVLDMNDPWTLRTLARGIVRQENGYDPYPASLYDRAFPRP